jgi:hypothetical protein
MSFLHHANISRRWRKHCSLAIHLPHDTIIHHVIIPVAPTFSTMPSFPLQACHPDLAVVVLAQLRYRLLSFVFSSRIVVLVTSASS